MSAQSASRALGVHEAIMPAASREAAGMEQSPCV